jgi:hypothetical protein
MDLWFDSGTIETSCSFGKVKPVTEKQRMEILKFTGDVYMASHLVSSCGKRCHQADVPKFWEIAKSLKKNGITDVWETDRQEKTKWKKLQKKMKGDKNEK